MSFTKVRHPGVTHPSRLWQGKIGWMVSFPPSSEAAEQQVDGGVDRRLDALFSLTSQGVHLHHVHP